MSNLSVFVHFLCVLCQSFIDRQLIHSHNVIHLWRLNAENALKSTLKQATIISTDITAYSEEHYRTEYLWHYYANNLELSLCYLLTSGATRHLRRALVSLLHSPRPVTIGHLRRVSYIESLYCMVWGILPRGPWEESYKIYCIVQALLS